MVALEFGEPFQGRRLSAVRRFLQEAELDYDEGVQFTVNLMEDDEIIGTGSLDRNTLKCIAIAPNHQGEGLTATLLTALLKHAFERGVRHLFLFTKPKNHAMFADLGFYPISRTADTLLMENERNGIQNFVASLECPSKEGVIGCVVANCNPFTNGHRYLMETAAKACDLVHVFILSEDRSAFSAQARMQLAKAGTADLKNIVVHPTSDYMISSATFPSYFIKDKARVESIQCQLDLTIFADHFAKPLGIAKRFVGTEPFCPVTSVYNRQMKEFLPTRGIEVVEILRCTEGGASISASRVRALLKEGRLEEIRPLVPPTTFAYLERGLF